MDDIDDPTPAPAAAVRWSEQTFGDALAWAARTHAGREALVCGDERLRFEELAARAWAFAAGLLELGVRRGEHVALWMGDGIEWMVARWAVPAIGAVLVPVNTRLRAADLAFVLAQSRVSTLILQDGSRGVDYLALLGRLVPDLEFQAAGAWSSPALPALRRVVGLSGRPLPPGVAAFASVEAAGAQALQADDGRMAFDAARAAVRPDDVAQILYTSGTTSEPKGAMVRHGALLQNNAHTLERMQLTVRDRYLSCVPLFSATGTGYTLSMLLAGAAIVILDRFEPRRFCEAVERERITAGFFIDAIVQDLRDYPERASHDLSSLRTGTGAPLSPASFRYASVELGVPQLIGVYGMSETSNAVCRGDVRDPFEIRASTNGRPVPEARVRIVDAGTGVEVGPGTIGEICVQGPLLMAGYHDRPDEDARAIDAEGWFHTGDLGELDMAGRLVFRGRLKEMIKPGGFNVATLEIETFIKACPGVREAVVVGVPDVRLGEVAYAFVRLQDGARLDATRLKAWCRERIAGYKVPRHVEFVDEFPMTGSGKIRKLELKERARAAVGDAGAPA